MSNKKIYPWVVVGLLWGVALLNYMEWFTATWHWIGLPTSISFSS